MTFSRGTIYLRVADEFDKVLISLCEGTMSLDISSARSAWVSGADTSIDVDACSKLRDGMT